MSIEPKTIEKAGLENAGLGPKQLAASMWITPILVAMSLGWSASRKSCFQRRAGPPKADAGQGLWHD